MESSLTRKEYWNSNWRGQESFRNWSADPAIVGFDAFLARRKDLQPRAGDRLLELGCGGSHWLSYFRQRWGIQVEGIDYAEEGVALTEAILARDQIPGVVHLGDIFSPPEHLVGAFHVVFSAGVLEHFPDTAGALKSFGSFLAPGGRLITIIPNMRGLMGLATRLLAPRIYRVHVPLSREDLKGAAARAGLELLHCNYFLPLNLGVMNLSPVRPRILRQAVGDVGNILSRMACRIIPSLTSRVLSPYILSIGIPARQGSPQGGEAGPC